jgi:predicted lipoprotein with Yx(FWY)xxD motif
LTGSVPVISFLNYEAGLRGQIAGRFDGTSTSPKREEIMKRIMVAGFAALLLVGWIGVALADHHAVKIAEKEGLGKYLTDAKGMTLYWYKKDAPGTSTCAGPCVERWPLYFRESVAPPPGVKAEDFGTITREDGKKQTTFRGYPLYYWFKDEKAGDATGHKVNDVWFVVEPANFPPK